MPGDKRVFNIMPSRSTEKDLTMADAVLNGLMTTQNPEIQESIDLREPWWGVGNQEATGSCIGWAVADGILRWHFVKANKIKDIQKLSPRFIWMASKELDLDNLRPTSFLELAGTYIKDALKIPLIYGTAFEEDLPFRGGQIRIREIDFFEKISALKISAYYNLLKAEHNISELKKWLSHVGPVIISVKCDKEFVELQAPGKLKQYGNPSAYGIHALVIAGYTKDEFILRNSWGPGWGDKGFAYVSNDWLQSAVEEAFGISI